MGAFPRDLALCAGDGCADARPIGRCLVEPALLDAAGIA
jgi:hypothetical protein